MMPLINIWNYKADTYLSREELADSDSVIIPYMVMNRLYTT